MKYFHVRRNGNELCATIAADPTPTGIKYGVAIVSPTEMRGKVAYATGRAIAESRVGKFLMWKTYHTTEDPRTRNIVVRTFTDLGLFKAGTMPTNSFRTAIKAVRIALNDTYIAKKGKTKKPAVER